MTSTTLLNKREKLTKTCSLTSRKVDVSWKHFPSLSLHGDCSTKNTVSSPNSCPPHSPDMYFGVYGMSHFHCHFYSKYDMSSSVEGEALIFVFESGCRILAVPTSAPCWWRRRRFVNTPGTSYPAFVNAVSVRASKQAALLDCVFLWIY